MKTNVLFLISILLLCNSVFAQIKKHRKLIRKQPFKEMVIQKDKQEINRIVKLYKANELDEAKALLKKMIKKSPQENWHKAMLSVVEFRLNNFVAAKKLAAAVMKKNNKSVLAHLVFAGLAKENQHSLAAADHLRKAKKFADKPYEKDIIRHLVDNYKISEKPKINTISFVEIDQSQDLDLPYIAVFPFEQINMESELSNLSASVSEMMVTALIQTNLFKVIERTQLDKIIEEQALGQTGALDDQTAVDVGHILGVNAIVVGSISTLNSVIEFDVRLLNAENGEAIAASNGASENESEIRSTVNKLANSLAKYSNKIPLKVEENKSETK